VQIVPHAALQSQVTPAKSPMFFLISFGARSAAGQQKNVPPDLLISCSLLAREAQRDNRRMCLLIS
jgi:hypothetical protein